MFRGIDRKTLPKVYGIDRQLFVLVELATGKGGNVDISPQNAIKVVFFGMCSHLTFVFSVADLVSIISHYGRVLL